MQIRDALAVRDLKIPCSRPETPTLYIQLVSQKQPRKPWTVRTSKIWTALIRFEVKQRSLHGISGSNSEDSVSRFENGPLELVLGDVQDSAVPLFCNKDRNFEIEGDLEL